MRPIIFALLATSALSSLGGCSSSPISAIGSITGNSISDTDRVFLMAAGSWDRNRDSVVTCDEWKAYATELFDGADANRDDALDSAEWTRIVSIDRLFSTADASYFDANGDGKVSRAELVDRRNPAFTLLDKTNTCTLNASQVAGARSATQYDTFGAKKEDGDPREKAGEQGRAANGGIGR